MSSYILDIAQQTAVNFSPATVAEEVGQNIRTILTTPYGSSPLARNIGLDYNLLDDPAPIVEARLVGEIMTAIAAQEPRAVVDEVSFGNGLTDALSGRLAAVVRYHLSGEV